MQQAGDPWWLYAWAVWIAFNAAVLVLYPTVIAPLFNKFTPLADESLKTRVQALMQRCGFAAKGLFVMDGSRRSAHGNAYFTGLGAAKRVVFFDTLLDKLTPGEVEAVLAHELGHFKHKHILQRIVMVFGLSLVALALLGWLAQQPWFYAGLGVAPNRGGVPNDALALLLLMFALPPFGFLVKPLLSALPPILLIRSISRQPPEWLRIGLEFLANEGVGRPGRQAGQRPQHPGQHLAFHAIQRFRHHHLDQVEQRIAQAPRACARTRYFRAGQYPGEQHR